MHKQFCSVANLPPPFPHEDSDLLGRRRFVPSEFIFDILVSQRSQVNGQEPVQQ